MQFNGHLLRIARQYRGFQQQDLAKALGVEASTLSRAENAVAAPSDVLVKKLAVVLGFPETFFFENDRIFGLPVSVHPSMWRKRASVSQAKVDQAIACINLIIMSISRMMRSVHYEPDLQLPFLDIDDYEGDAEKIAMLVRRAWLMPSGPVTDLTSWIERAGIIVVHLDLPDSAMDGVTIRVPDAPPCIFLNRRQSADRLRLTLAHELGHLVMHRMPSPDMETEANVFAGSFLMPALDIREHFSSRRIDLPLLAALKPEWRVSMAALLYRAGQLGYINDNQKRYLWQQFSSTKIKLREPPELDFPVEEPSLLKSVLDLHFGELGYTHEELVSALSLSLTHLQELFGVTRNEGSAREHLRIVR